MIVCCILQSKPDPITTWAALSAQKRCASPYSLHMVLNTRGRIRSELRDSWQPAWGMPRNPGVSHTQPAVVESTSDMLLPLT